jgi:hypothetical protein
MSKLVSGVASYPLTTLRTRIQQNQYFEGSNTPKYKDVIDILVKVWQEEGIPGYFKGLVPNLLKGVLQRGAYFYCYELLKYWMNADQYKQKH